MSNFNFLNEKYPELAKLGEFAEKNIYISRLKHSIYKTRNIWRKGSKIHHKARRYRWNIYKSWQKPNK